MSNPFLFVAARSSFYVHSHRQTTGYSFATEDKKKTTATNETIHHTGSLRTINRLMRFFFVSLYLVAAHWIWMIVNFGWSVAIINIGLTNAYLLISRVRVCNPWVSPIRRSNTLEHIFASCFVVKINSFLIETNTRTFVSLTRNFCDFLWCFFVFVLSFAIH